MTDPTQRLNDIEQSLSHQARLAEVLNEVVYEHSRQIAAFQDVLKRLESRLQGLEQGTSAGDPGSTADEASPWKDPEM
ncbi:MAG: putative coiled-coil protein SlyX [Planctomycetota bacterium]|jgi:uncharacterized coiled-coil protein SlyX